MWVSRARLALEAHVAQHGCRRRQSLFKRERSVEGSRGFADFAEVVAAANATGVALLIADMELALAMLERASVSMDATTPSTSGTSSMRVTPWSGS